jgi:predicted TIM-barrel fold metal-dependent hydrolase
MAVQTTGALPAAAGKWVLDAAVRKKILVDNPARLFGFEAAAG